MKSDKLNRPTGFAARLADRMVELRVMLAVVASTILAVCAPLSQRLQMDRTINQMFAADDPTLVAYEELRAAFGGNAAVLLVYHDDELMSLRVCSVLAKSRRRSLRSPVSAAFYRQLKSTICLVIFARYPLAAPIVKLLSRCWIRTIWS